MEKKKEEKKKEEKKKKKGKKSKFAIYWESKKEPGFEVVDMKAILR
ncbi:MAG: hypothetical protein LBF62_01755 [Tannerellaceae bacterium]|jgi:hypothetical protein|nr:hypothetical protein [Tannerellaceae bacterium]